jgi:hypothetical protein
MNKTNSFHNLVDAQVRPYQVYTGGIWGGLNPYTTTYINSVDYQFFAHFHPYVKNLIQNLDNGGIVELLDSDTVYLPNTSSKPASGKPLEVQANTTKAILLAAVNVTLSSGTTVTLTAGTPLTLQDNTNITLPNPTTVQYTDGTIGVLTVATQVQLPGNIPASAPSGIQWSIGGKDTIVPDGTSVQLHGAASAVLTYDGSPVTLPDLTPISMSSGLPQPFLFEDFFAANYHPGPNVQLPYPVKNLDFTIL